MIRSFEEYDLEKDENNLGNESKFASLEELAQDDNSPDKIIMRREDVEEEIKKSGIELREETSSEDLEPDTESSNWEDDVEAGKYDQGAGIIVSELESDGIEIIPSQSFVEKHRSVEIENLTNAEKKGSKHELFTEYSEDESHVAKAKKSRGDGESIRFDDVA